MSIILQQHPATVAGASGEAFREQAADGFSLGGFTWRHGKADSARAVVIINAATSVRCRFYFRFAEYLFANGFDVIVYDYRGIGESRAGVDARVSGVLVRLGRPGFRGDAAAGDACVSRSAH